MCECASVQVCKLGPGDWDRGPGPGTGDLGPWTGSIFNFVSLHIL